MLKPQRAIFLLINFLYFAFFIGKCVLIRVSLRIFKITVILILQEICPCFMQQTALFGVF